MGRANNLRSYLLLVSLMPLVSLLVVSTASARRSLVEYRDAEAYSESSESQVLLANLEDAIRAESVLALELVAITSTDVRETSTSFQARVISLDVATTSQLAPAVAATDHRVEDVMTADLLPPESSERLQRLPEVRERLFTEASSPAEIDLFYQRLLEGVHVAQAGRLDEIADTGDATLQIAVEQASRLRELTIATGDLQRDLTTTIGRLMGGGSSEWEALADSAADVRSADAAFRASLGFNPAARPNAAGLELAYLDGLDSLVRLPSSPSGEQLDTALDILSATRNNLAATTGPQNQELLQLTTLIALKADNQRSEARREFIAAIGLMLATVLLVLGSATIIGRAIVRPLLKVAEAAERVNQGELAAPPPTDQGPAEVRQLSSALGNMIGTIAVIERQAKAMAAGDLSNEALGEHLPGDLGRSLESTIEQWRATAHEAQVTNALNSAISAATSDAQLLANADLEVVEANPAAATLFGQSTSHLIGRRLSEILDVDSWDRLSRQLAEAHTATAESGVITNGGTVQAIVSTTRATSGDRHVYSMTLRDISDRQALLDRLTHEIQVDRLTGLGTRHRFVEQLRTALKDGPVGMILVDLDGFKTVNDRHGNRVGDLTLKTIARRLERAAGPARLVARMGSDEFAIMVPGMCGLSDTQDLAYEILDALSDDISLNRTVVSLTSSIGVAWSRDAGAEVLMKHATIAHRRAKQEEGAAVVAYDQALIDRLEERRQIALELNDAITTNALQLWYQPVVDTNSGRVVSAEALLRWPQPDGTMRPPGIFIPLAEESDLIVRVDEWVIGECCRQLKEWESDPDLAGVRISINISGRHLDQGEPADAIADACERYDIAPSRLAVEITESYLVTDLERCRSILEQLHMIGVKLYIDDFGTGYSSLAYLQELPFDVLKIDQTFVKRLGTTDTSDSITKALVMLSSTMGLQVLAEGVETDEQLRILHDFGCHQVQGYLLCRPSPPTTFREFVIEAQECPIPDRGSIDVI